MHLKKRFMHSEIKVGKLVTFVTDCFGNVDTTGTLRERRLYRVFNQPYCQSVYLAAGAPHVGKWI
jgi:hypothetical protein